MITRAGMFGQVSRSPRVSLDRGGIASGSVTVLVLLVLVYVGSEGLRWFDAALSLALTAGLMVWWKVPHPPAGATTLIVSLGILRTPTQLAVLMLAVVLLTVQGFVINRLAGVDYPRWRSGG